MLSYTDVGLLKRGVRVKVGKKLGAVYDAHEPEWIDYKTKAFKKELRGASILFDGETRGLTYVDIGKIDLVQ